MSRYTPGWTWDKDTYTFRCNRCPHEVSGEMAREYGLRKLHHHDRPPNREHVGDSIDWRPYTEHAPHGEPLWLLIQSGDIFPGEWSDCSGFIAPFLPLGVLITHWAPREPTETLTPIPPGAP